MFRSSPDLQTSGSMSLTILGTAANVFGVVTPAKDVFEVLKGIVDSIEEVSLFFKPYGVYVPTILSLYRVGKTRNQ